MLSFKPRFLAIGISGLFFLTACNADESKTTAASSPAKPEAPLKIAAADTSAKPAAVVNGVPISESRIDMILKERAAQGMPDSPEARKDVRDDLVTRELIAQEAIKKGLDKRPDVGFQMDMARQSVLVRAYLQDYIKSNPVSDDVLKAEYERIKGQMGDKEYKARHVLVEKESEAKDIIAQLKKGKKIEALAKDKSKDPGSKDKGGDLGWITPGSVVKPFGDALAKLEKGRYTTEPVQSQFGWHVIKLEDVRPVKAPAFDEVKGNLGQRVQQQQVEKIVADLRAGAKVELPNQPAAAPAPAAPAAPATPSTAK